ncbi:uncharacterized protein PHACADRAFT_206524 [Phanerochaete carnosa HHB-10118-sp]|uniref:Uncharacterized protein n=1 Tax=Phanerochaete carnosa (strain HHB-10118-sp) TaxID=650164 RepID=K5W1A8_PHACS|nr:uncharacterized protein PHACADRAFT_206524 [Phanerochaete carnosa HHB-10118-sp]EKM57638.1 hypothetical protein PHACADRAFT_206524 [Phanerochaete carnosa HHB-10118-sp]
MFNVKSFDLRGYIHLRSPLSSEMHRCLHIEEIIRIITSFRVGSMHAVQLNLDLTCRSFYESAMDTLWGDLDKDIEPLLLILPSYALKRVKYEVLKSQGTGIGTASATMLNVYAVWSSMMHHIAYTKIPSGSSARSTLAPTYYRTSASHEGAYLYEAWEKLVPPTLEEASVIHFDEENEATAFLDALINCPSPKRLCYEEDKLMMMDHEAVRLQVNRVLIHLKQLTVVRARPLFPGTIQHLASLPILKEIEFFLDVSTDCRVPFGSEVDIVPFSALKKLHIGASATSDKALLTFLDTICSTCLEAIHVTFGLDGENPDKLRAKDYEPSPAWYINRVTEALSRFTRSKRVYLSAIGQHINSAALVFDTDTLTPLLRLQAITSLDLGRSSLVAEYPSARARTELQHHAAYTEG